MSGFDGTWETLVKTPMGGKKAELTIATNGDTLTGTSSNADGSTELENGKVEGNHAFWTLKMAAPIPMNLEVSVTLDGDSLAGVVQAGVFGKMPISGTRVA